MATRPSSTVPHRVRLIHWNAQEAAVRAEAIAASGYDVDASPLDQSGLKALRADPPSAFVIDLSRLPSHGREVASALRSWKTTRTVPLVFVGGEPEKVERVRAILPDAAFTTWDRIGGALRTALRRPVTNPVPVPSGMAAYSGTPLPQKLGIKAGHLVALVGAPAGFESVLAPLPEGVVFQRGLRLPRRAPGASESSKSTGSHGSPGSGTVPDITLWFLTSRRAFEGEIARMVPLAAGGGRFGHRGAARPNAGA